MSRIFFTIPIKKVNKVYCSGGQKLSPQEWAVVKLEIKGSWKKVQPTTNGCVKLFGTSGKMQANFYAVLVKSCVILPFHSSQSIFGDFLKFLEIQWRLFSK